LRDVSDDVGTIPLWRAVTVNMMKPGHDFTPIQHQRAFEKVLEEPDFDAESRSFVIPANAGIQHFRRSWIPAFAGMTMLRDPKIDIP
jgi:hypothetical protein